MKTQFPFFGYGTGRGADAARNRPAENLDHQPQAKALVGLGPAHRQDRAGRVAVQAVRVARRLAFAVEQPAFRALLAGDLFDADFSFGRGAGAEIQHQRLVFIRDADRQRIRRKPRGLAARRGHANGRPVRVDHQHRYQPLGRGQLAVFSQPADVAAVGHRADPHPFVVGLGRQHFQEPHRLHLAEAPVGIGDDPRRPLVEHRQLLARRDFAVLDRLDVIRNPHHAMRVIAPQVRLNQAFADDLSLVGRCPPGLQEGNGERLELRSRNGGHGSRESVFRFQVSGFRVQAGRNRECSGANCAASIVQRRSSAIVHPHCSAPIILLLPRLIVAGPLAALHCGCGDWLGSRRRSREWFFWSGSPIGDRRGRLPSRGGLRANGS